MAFDRRALRQIDVVIRTWPGGWRCEADGHGVVLLAAGGEAAAPPLHLDRVGLFIAVATTRAGVPVPLAMFDDLEEALARLGSAVTSEGGLEGGELEGGG